MAEKEHQKSWLLYDGWVSRNNPSMLKESVEALNNLNSWNLIATIDGIDYPITKKKGGKYLKAVKASLEAQEQKLYNKFNCNNFNDFMNKLHIFFDEKQPFAQALFNLRRDSLTAMLQNEKGEMDALNKSIDNLLEKSGVDQNDIIEVDYNMGDKSFLDLKGMTTTIKALLQRILKEQKVKEVQNKTRSIAGLDKESAYTTSLRKIINDIIISGDFQDDEAVRTWILSILQEDKGIENENDKKIIAEIFVEAKRQQTQGQNVKAGKVPFPWGYTSETWEQLVEVLKSQGKTEQDIIELAVQALRTMVKRIIRYPEVDNIIDNYITEQSFLVFMHGEGFITNFVGKMGELQGQILFKELGNRFGVKTASEIIGQDKDIWGRDLKADQIILKTIGIQMKNYSTGLLGRIDTNVGLSNLQGIKSGEEGGFRGKIKDSEDNGTPYTNFSNFFVNYCIGQTKKEKLKQNFLDILANNIDLLYSFDVYGDAKNNVLFYLVGGEYLVPVSHILEAMENAPVPSVELNQKAFQKVNLQTAEYSNIFKDISFRSTMNMNYVLSSVKTDFSLFKNCSLKL